ncbi:hypothetical protein HGM15179_018115 [Zosterops borbonicus]|uniref:Uncharacterized protein n=1 Tax=Zosterops borbonicus TaxID=364589 RepID=A0A8K1LCJ9_9PASS|nr:hypothetical protein HGM15179_018115 [Zosterops borbonicus]
MDSLEEKIEEGHQKLRKELKETIYYISPEPTSLPLGTDIPQQRREDTLCKYWPETNHAARAATAILARGPKIPAQPPAQSSLKSIIVTASATANYLDHPQAPGPLWVPAKAVKPYHELEGHPAEYCARDDQIEADQPLNREEEEEK